MLGDKFPDLRDSKAELAGDVTNLILLVTRHPFLVAKIPLALVIGHIDFSLEGFWSSIKFPYQRAAKPLVASRTPFGPQVFVQLLFAPIPTGYEKGLHRCRCRPLTG